MTKQEYEVLLIRVEKIEIALRQISDTALRIARATEAVAEAGSVMQKNDARRHAATKRGAA